MSSVKVECAVNRSALIGEGPIWEESEQTLLFVDILGKTIHRWSLTTNQTTSLQTGDQSECSTDRHPQVSYTGVLFPQTTRWASRSQLLEVGTWLEWVVVSQLLIGRLEL